MIDLSSGGSIDPRLALGLRDAFAGACIAAEIDVAFEADAAGAIAVGFPGQEGAPPEVMTAKFVELLAERGVACDARLAPASGMDERELRRAEAALVEVAHRMRALLVELNSYLSGGLDCPFDGVPAEVRQRGAAVYRFPKDGGTRVSARVDAIRIEFEGGDLGKVTSSGFYLPTRLRGDLRVEARYRILEWRPGELAASLALFVQDEPALHRWYSQRTAAACDGDRHRVLANITGELQHSTVVTGEGGRMALERRGEELVIQHASPQDAWQTVYRGVAPTAADLFVGAKLWAERASGALRAEFCDLVVDAEIPADQPPLLPVRRDPRD